MLRARRRLLTDFTAAPRRMKRNSSRFDWTQVGAYRRRGCMREEGGRRAAVTRILEDLEDDQGKGRSGERFEVRGQEQREEEGGPAPRQTGLVEVSGSNVPFVRLTTP